MNNILMDTLYNASIKFEFLSSYPLNTQATYTRIFIQSSLLEKEYNKDLYGFKLDKIEAFLHKLEPLTLTASKHNSMIISKYLKWAVEAGYVDREADIMNGKSTEWFEQFIDQDKEVYMSEKELVRIIRDSENAQDSVIIQLLFEGVQGNSCSEIRNLKKSDVQFDTGILLLTNDKGTTRTHSVSQKALDLIQGAIEQVYYHKNNGVLPETTKSTHSQLVDSEYVIRPSNTASGRQDQPVDRYVIYRRVSMVAEYYGKPYMNPKNIYRSGMLKFAHDLSGRDNELGDTQIKEVASKYQVKSWWSLKEFITIENIKKLYPMSDK